MYFYSNIKIFNIHFYCEFVYLYLPKFTQVVFIITENVNFIRCTSITHVPNKFCAVKIAQGLISWFLILIPELIALTLQ